MKLSARLKAIVELVEHDTIADIGTDHAFVPITCLMTKRIKNAIATDLHAGPLQIAKQNIISHGFSDFIETRLCNGLDGLKAREVDTIIISGMGGLMIREILTNGLQILKHTKQLILQPQNNVMLVRKFLLEHGFNITNEVFLHQSNYYNIIDAQRDANVVPYSEVEYAVGKLLMEQEDTSLLRSFLLHKTNRWQHAKDYSDEVNKLYELYMEAIECLVKK